MLNKELNRQLKEKLSAYLSVSVGNKPPQEPINVFVIDAIVAEHHLSTILTCFLLLSTRQKVSCFQLSNQPMFLKTGGLTVP